MKAIYASFRTRAEVAKLNDISDENLALRPGAHRPKHSSAVKRTTLSQVKECFAGADIEEWGRVRRIDSEAGDTIRALSMISGGEVDMRDATFVRVRPHLLYPPPVTYKGLIQYEMFVDNNESYRNKAPDFELKTFYGQLENIFLIKFDSKTPRDRLGISNPAQDTVILAAIRTCILNNDSQLEDLDIHFYSKLGALHVTDIVAIQCLVGRVKDQEPHTWGIIDRSGSLARAVVVDED
jgi:hypothetical protein